MVEDTLGEGRGILFPKARDGGDVDRLRKMLEPRYKRYQRYVRKTRSDHRALIRREFYDDHVRELTAIIRGEVDLTPERIMVPVGSLLSSTIE